jgi:NAD(P)-dependent dehydrogenase (short-subunit alcohol dehydrogenase family)
VTGARSGIGHHTALQLARAGYKVYAGVRAANDALPLLQAAARIDRGLAIMPITLDVTAPDDRSRAIADIAAVDGRLDLLVNNAGVALDGPLELVSDEEIQHLFDVNVFGAFALTREALPLMRHRGRGRVIMMSSMSGRMALPCMGAYAASKFALEGLGEAWRHELAPFGIDLVLVEPGPFKTDLFRSDAISRATAASAGARGPYRRLIDRFLVLREAMVRQAGDPIEVAETVVRLARAREVPLRVPVGTSAKIRTALQRFMPESALSRIIGGVFGVRQGPVTVDVRIAREPETRPAARSNPDSRWGVRPRIDDADRD